MLLGGVYVIVGTWGNSTCPMFLKKTVVKV